MTTGKSPPTGDCCPPGYVCDDASSCLLTMRLSFTAAVLTTTVSSGLVPIATNYITTTLPIGTSQTAVGRILEEDRQVTSENNNGNRLTEVQIGAIVGAVVGFLVLVLLSAMGILWRYRTLYRSRRGGSEDVDDKDACAKPELDAHDTEAKELSNGKYPVEVPSSPLPHELVGGYEAHGISELDGEPKLVAVEAKEL